MKTGNAIGRQWLLILSDGRAVLDWGDQQYQDLLTGEFTRLPEVHVSHSAIDSDLEALKRAGLIANYDNTQVFLNSLPERNLKSLG